MAELTKLTTDLSALKGEEQVVVEGDVVKKYKVVEEKIDLAPLKEELAILEAEKEPTDEEVLQWGRDGRVHPYYENKLRIEEIKFELEKWQ